ncbi:hypothetical protein [Bacterioplanoides sp.]|uniref:hypothetical protein n=2 Tax=Bacterioplanoides sp. TaxID=2066072 RepID=UPI003BACCFC8
MEFLEFVFGFVLTLFYMILPVILILEIFCMAAITYGLYCKIAYKKGLKVMAIYQSNGLLKLSIIPGSIIVCFSVIGLIGIGPIREVVAFILTLQYTLCLVSAWVLLFALILKGFSKMFRV